MNLIYTSCISEATFDPKILAIEERDGQYYEYEPSQISRDAVRKILENQTPNLVTLEYLIVKYPSLKEKLLPHLRDKKLDELI